MQAEEFFESTDTEHLTPEDKTADRQEQKENGSAKTENEKYLDAAVEKAFQDAKTKMYVRYFAAFIGLVVIGAIAGITFKSFVTALVPALCGLPFIFLAVYNYFSFKKDRIKGAIAICVDSKFDAIGGVTSGMTAKKKFYFDYETEKGEEGSFYVSRGTFLNSIAVGHYYLILHRTPGVPAADNFIACEELQGRLFGKKPEYQETKKRKSFSDRMTDMVRNAKEQADRETRN